MTTPHPTNPDRDRSQPDEPLEDLDTEVVEDLDVGEDANDVRGGFVAWTTECLSYYHCDPH